MLLSRSGLKRVYPFSEKEQVKKRLEVQQLRLVDADLATNAFHTFRIQCFREMCHKHEGMLFLSTTVVIVSFVSLGRLYCQLYCYR